MTYDALILSSLKDMLAQMAGFIPNFIIVLGILIVGTIIAKVLSKVVGKVFTKINLDKIADKIGITPVLKKSGIEHKPVDLLSTLVYWVVMVMVLIVTVKAIGLTVATSLLDRLFAYIPNVISGVLVLIFGFLLAKVVSGLIYTAACNTDISHPEVLSHLGKLAIVVYATVIFLKEVGLAPLLEGTNATILFAGAVLALAIAFGLGGKDMASKYLEALKLRKNGRS